MRNKIECRMRNAKYENELNTNRKLLCGTFIGDDAICSIWWLNILFSTHKRWFLWISFSAREWGIERERVRWKKLRCITLIIMIIIFWLALQQSLNCVFHPHIVVADVAVVDVVCLFIYLLIFCLFVCFVCCYYLLQLLLLLLQLQLLCLCCRCVATLVMLNHRFFHENLRSSKDIYCFVVVDPYRLALQLLWSFAIISFYCCYCLLFFFSLYLI